MNGLVAIGLRRSYGATLVLDGVDLQAPAGSLTAILGPSGCGKTTFLRLLAGFDRPDAGTIHLAGRVLYEGGRSVAPERRKIGYVAQEGALFPHLTVGENVAFGLRAPGETARRRVADLLTMVGLDPAVARRQPHQLSGGQQQRVALARALAPEPDLILLDEPFASLDAGLRDSTRRAVAESLTAAGATTVLVTHDRAEALVLADQVAVMRRGRLAQVAAPAELYRHPVDVELATALGEAIVLDAEIQDGLADCALGRVPTAPGAPNGTRQLMLRPEQLSLTDAGAAASVSARVTGVAFFGHDALVHLETAGGARVLARPPGYATPSIGEMVGVVVRGTAHVF